MKLGQWDTNTIYNVDALELLKGLPDESVDAIITDPPYGCGSQVSAWRSPDERFKEIQGALEIDASWLADAFRVVKQGGAAYVFAKWVNVGEWLALLEAAGFSVRNCLIWDKMQHGTGDLEGSYAPQYEMVLFCAKGRHLLRTARTPDIIRHPKVQPQLLRHPYEKPVSLLERFVLKSTDADGLVVDPFAGSGSSLRAAQKNHREYLGSEVDPAYVSLAQSQLEQNFSLSMFEATP